MPISFKSLNKNAKTLFIGICGGSGSGKSHFLEKLVDHFEANEICLISQDNYYKPVGSQKKDAHGMVNFDLPGSFNKASLLQDLKDLLAGKKVYRPKYNFNNPTIPPSMITYKPAPITLIEGIFIFHYTKIASLLDVKLFIDSEETLGLNRRIARDKTERALSLDAVLYQWQNHVMPAYRKYSLPYRKNADLIIHNSESPLNVKPLLDLIMVKKNYPFKLT